MLCLESTTHTLETLGMELKTILSEFHFKLLDGHELIFNITKVPAHRLCIKVSSLSVIDDNDFMMLIEEAFQG